VSSFSAEWLALREPFDIAARDDELAHSFLAEVNLRAQRSQVAQGTQGLQGAQAGPVVDLGAGTGSNISRLRSLAAKLGHQLCRHVDNDGDLLALARQRFSGDSSVSIEQRDICLALDAALQGASAVTCAALLDLVSAAWINQLADLLASGKLPLLALLSYDGRMQWSLAAGDSAMLTAMNASLRAAALRAAHGPERNAIEAWSARRARQIAGGKVSLVVDHQELLATWP
jgi:hypothetical protein